MANFEPFCRNKKLSSNLFFLKRACNCSIKMHIKIRPHLTSHMKKFNLPLLPVNVQEYAKSVASLHFQFACLYFPPQGFLFNPSIH